MSALTKLKTLLETLRDDMADDYDPTFTYVYDHHDVAALLLNAVTIETEEYNYEAPLGSDASVVSVKYDITATIRVHTAYYLGGFDFQDNLDLLNSISNYLNEHRDLGDSYRIYNISPLQTRREFDESKSRGGELTVTIRIFRDYTQ